MKKFLAIVLALTIVLGLCACGGSGGGSGDRDTMTADGKVKLSIGLGSNALIMDHDNNALTKWLEEKCGVELQFQLYNSGSDLATQVSATVAARKPLPDILFGVELNDDLISRYGKDGYFVDLTSYFEDRDGASKIFWDRVENELSEEQQEYVKRNIIDRDTGKYFGMPSMETSLIDKMGYQLWINTQWLDALNMEKPTNNQELYDFLKAVKEGDPNGNGDTDDEIPLIGSVSSDVCSNVINWLINLFVYYNTEANYLVGEDGKLTPPYITDEYREALCYINKLYKEGLLSSMAWTVGGKEMKGITTPTAGTALCGIFAGHLTVHTNQNSEVMYQYEPLQTWGNAIMKNMSCSVKTFITADCPEESRDKAFEVLMTLFSWDGSMRQRYGEYGVNWMDADEGAKSDLGLDATYKLIRDPLLEQNSAKWGSMGSMLNVYAEGETAQISDQMSEWLAKKSQMHAESYQLFMEAMENNNPEKVCPTLAFTSEELESKDMVRTNVGNYYRRAQTDFCTGENGMDPNDDAKWQEYLNELEKLGLKEVVELAQTAYDRQ